MAKKPVKQEQKNDDLSEIKKVAKRYYKEKKFSEVKEMYQEIFEEYSEKYKNLSEELIHKKAFARFKNLAKKSTTGTAVDSYKGLILGVSKLRDMNANKKAKIIEQYNNDMYKTIEEGLLVTRTYENPETGTLEEEPILDKEQRVIPKDTTEFFTRKDGSQFKNPNYGLAIPTSYRKTVLAIVQDNKGNSGIALIELQDKTAEKSVNVNEYVKFDAKTMSSTVKEFNNGYVDHSLIESMMEEIETDVETGDLTEEFKNIIFKYYETYMKREPKEYAFYKLRSSRSTTFIQLKESEMKTLEIPTNINEAYKKYMYPLTSDCSHLLKFHDDNKTIEKKYVNSEGEEVTSIDTNYDEVICIQDANVVQINMEMSMSGNITMYVEDDSLFENDLMHLEKQIDTIKVLIPRHLKFDFGQDSKVNIVGSIFQFPAQDENGNDITKTIKGKDGKKEIVKILDYPTILAYGVHAIEEYKVSVETIDLTHEDTIEAGIESVELEEIEDVKDAIKQVKAKKSKKKIEAEEYEDTIEEGEEKVIEEPW